MPLHVYQCPACLVEFDELRDFHDQDIDHATCSRCGCLHCEKVYRQDTMGGFDKESAAPDAYDEQLGMVVPKSSRLAAKKVNLMLRQGRESGRIKKPVQVDWK